MKALRLPIILNLLVIISAGMAGAQVPGTLDSTFAINGVKILKPSSGFDNAYSVHLLPDGKMMVGGAAQISSGSNWDVVVYRLHANGSIDSTFGDNGFAYNDYQGYSQYVRTMKMLSNGKLLFVGGIENASFQVDVFATLLNADGTPDLSFGDNGTVLIPVGSGEDICTSAAEQPDGKVLIAGNSQVPGFIYHHSIVIRLNSDGTLDDSFGINGMATIDAGYDYESAEDLLLLDDGSKLVAGYAGNNSYDVLTFKLTDGGIPDVSYSTDGVAIFNLTNGDDMAYAITRSLFDNRILIGGKVGAGGTKTDFLALSITEAGLIDSTFGINGRAAINLKVNDTGLDLAIQSNGRIVLGGTSGAGFATNDFAICRFNADGSIDSTFGTNGVTLSEISSFFSDIEDIALQPDGKIVAVGIAASTNNDMGIVRYKGDDIATGELASGSMEPTAAFAIYPNPSKGLFTIEFNEPTHYSGMVTIQLISLLNQQIFEETTPMKHGRLMMDVNVCHKIQATGIYLMKIAAGSRVYSQQVMIQ